jgi:Gdp/GTP exchange factor required for growth at low temperatures
MSTPVAALANVESRLSVPNISDSAHLQAPKAKRRSRMSVHAFIPPSFKSVMTQQPLVNATGPQDSMTSAAPRGKLRKTRSIPDIFNGGSQSSSTVDVSGPEPGSSMFTGRAHSHSVTGADMPRLPATMVDVARAPNGDIFGDVMGWTGTIHPSFPSGSGSARFARVHMSHVDGSTPEHSHPARVFPQPFGPTVAFDLPSPKPTADYLSMPHMLREVQSFESGLTARASDLEVRGPGKPDSPLSTTPDHSTESTPHASFLPIIKEPTLDPELDTQPPESPCLTPLPETSMHSRYSTDVFDVLQTYRGLPLFDRMDDNIVIKMSYQPDDTATPRDDPRFVLWGETKVLERDDLSVSQGSYTDLSSAHSSHASRRKSSKTGKADSVTGEPPALHVPAEESSHRILAAATIERWIAQLTSDLNYDELLNFFLTYRTYISAVDLCHLLICRFHWALGKNNSAHDEMVRRIVRVRTFVAIRYWLLTFFNVDFLPNRELRLSLAGWLNALIRDPILKIHSDGLVRYPLQADLNRRAHLLFRA